MIDPPSARRRLAAELAVGLARRLSMTLEPGDTPGYYWHYAQTTFEEGCDVLWELGVALTLVATENDYQGMTRQQYVDAKRRPGQETFAVYKFFPAPETRAGVLARGELPERLFERLLASYVETACDYGPDGTQLWLGPEPFKPMVEFEREIDAFVECGYAERHGDMVKWTHTMAAVMRANACWDAPEPQIKTLSPDVLQRVDILVQDRNPIAAIALVRAETGASIVECKAYVEDLERKSHRMPPHRPRR